MLKIAFSVVMIMVSATYVAHAVEAVQKKPSFDEKLVGETELGQLRQGGFVIYMRHGATDSKTPDQLPIDLSNCSTQRPLTAAGIAELEQIATFFKKANIPYDEVLASPLCRAKQTAEIVFGQPVVVELNLQYTAGLTAQQKQPIIAKTRELISTPVAQGRNRILVAHGPNMVEMMAYFPVEATMVVIQPKGNNQFEYIASIPPKHWPVLLNDRAK